jgi:hypothetical protein
MSDIDYSKAGEEITANQIHELLLEDGKAAASSAKTEFHSRNSNPFLTADTQATDANGKGLSVHSEISRWDLNPVLMIDSSKYDADGKLLRSAHAEATKNDNAPFLTVETSEFAPGAVRLGSSKSEYKFSDLLHPVFIEKSK